MTSLTSWARAVSTARRAMVIIAVLAILCVFLSCAQLDKRVTTAGVLSEAGEKQDKETMTCTPTYSVCDIAAFSPTSDADWYAKLEAATDRAYLGEYFRCRGYDPGPDAFVLAARIDKNPDASLAYRFFSLGDSAFVFSMAEDGSERFWPASTVKLAASLLALMRAESLGIGLDDPMSFEDLGVAYQSSLRSLIRDAIVLSLNPPYNMLMLFVGLDRANIDYLRSLLHFPAMVLQRRYERAQSDDHLRLSPQFVVETASGRLEIASESSQHFFAEAPREANALRLAELAEWMRRAVLAHDELPISKSSLDFVMQCLLKAPSCIGTGVAKILGPEAKIYNKGGRVTGDDRLEVAVIIDETRNIHYLLAISLPHDDDVDAKCDALGEILLEALDAGKPCQ